MQKSPSLRLMLAMIGFLPLSILAQEPPALIPRPASLNYYPKAFLVRPGTSLRHDTGSEDLRRLAAWFRAAVHDVSGIRLATTGEANGSIDLHIDRSVPGGPEAYRLEVTTRRIRIEAASAAGLFYGLQTVLQTLPAVRTNATLAVPCMVVEDAPRFPWRGLHLDVSRHFFGPDVIREYIDLMARYKLNRFHWHLTDDPGWRLEIRKYPELTRTGAWRVDHSDRPYGARPLARPGETPTYGGYYTQEQVREIVAYARDRHVTIVPEIEMPGHSAAAIASYPRLSCTGKPQLPMTGGNYTGISSNFCPGNDSVFSFIADVLKEVMDIFPSEYIHIGGDEVDKSPWRACPRCQARIKAEGLHNEEELQSWFIKRVEKLIVSRNRRMIGWDEILEGGLAPTATVMSWRGEAGGIAAAKMGHDVVMTPGNPCYFDHYQAGPEGEPLAIGGMNTLQRVYAYEPVPAELSGPLERHVLGAQANVWTEFITTPEHLEYMILPRMPAMAEVLWSPRGQRDWQGFRARLRPHMRYFEQRGIRYSKGNFKVEIQPQPGDGRVVVALSTEAPDAEIRYTLDGGEPTVTSNRYEGPFPIRASGVLKAVTVVDGQVMGTVPARQEFSFHAGLGARLTYGQPPSRSYMASGLQALVDGVRGQHAVGQHWHGFEGRDLVATLDLGAEKSIRSLALGCLQRYTDWIFMPVDVRFETSLDGVTFRETAIVKDPVGAEQRNSTIHDFKASFAPRTARYVRVTAKARPDGCPPGHPGAGKPSWIFADELVVE
jgi:hexosaminidase